MNKTYTTFSPASLLPPSEITLLEKEMLEAAEGLSKASDCVPHKLGAILFKRRRILGRGFNQRRSHPLQAKYNPFSIRLHAEIHCLIDGLKEHGREIEGATMAIARRNRKRDLACSLPCRYCFSALHQSGIRRLVCYDANDEVTGINLT